MFVLRRSFQFADLELTVNSKCPAAAHQSQIPCHPDLPKGMRIDWCSLDSVVVDCIAGSRFTIGLKVQPATADGWEMNRETGEALDAITLRSRSGHVACVAMRDPDWMATRFALHLVSASSDISNLTATYEATGPTRPIVQIALAETSNPSNEQEALSPWFAVDKALNF